MVRDCRNALPGEGDLVVQLRNPWTHSGTRIRAPIHTFHKCSRKFKQIFPARNLQLLVKRLRHCFSFVRSDVVILQLEEFLVTMFNDATGNIATDFLGVDAATLWTDLSQRFELVGIGNNILIRHIQLLAKALHFLRIGKIIDEINYDPCLSLAQTLLDISVQFVPW